MFSKLIYMYFKFVNHVFPFSLITNIYIYILVIKENGNT